MVIKETLRMYCPAPATTRQALYDTTLGGYFIPKDTAIMISVLGAHFNPSVYDDPTLFVPERWLSENSAKINPYSWVPFLRGERSCTGQKFAMLEMKVIIAMLYKKLVFRPDSWSSVGMGSNLVIFPLHGIHVMPKLRELPTEGSC